MGKRGPRPAPTELKLVKGTRPSRVNTRGPKAKVTAEHPAPPIGMSDEAVEVWDRLAPELHKIGLLKDLDIDLFAAGCEAVIDHRTAVADVRARGQIIKTKNGNVKNPSLQLVRDSFQTMRAWAQEFGCSPSARSGIQLPDVGEDNAARRLLS